MHEEFMRMYGNSLSHGWVSSKIASIAAKQKQREKEYNRNYYKMHSDKWNRKDRISIGKYRKSDTAEQFKKLHPDPENYSEDGSHLSERQWNAQLSLLEAYDKRINGGHSEMASKAEQVERERARELREYGRRKAEEEKNASVFTKVDSLLDRAGVQLAKNLRKSGHAKAASFVNELVNKAAVSSTKISLFIRF